LRIRGGAGFKRIGMIITFDSDNLTQIENLVTYITKQLTDKSRHLLTNISPFNPFMVLSDANRKKSLVSTYGDVSQLNETQLKNHHMALRNLQRIIVDYGIPSFTLYSKIDSYNYKPIPESIETIYLADSTTPHEYVI
jgi:hypothetical protein